MGREVVTGVVDWDAALWLERARLVRFCTRFTGDVEAAEDLAQETLCEAWRHVHKLHDPAGRAQWLSAFARNVCLHWARQRSQEVARFAPLDAEALLPPATRTVLIERYGSSAHADVDHAAVQLVQPL